MAMCTNQWNNKETNLLLMVGNQMVNFCMLEWSTAEWKSFSWNMDQDVKSWLVGNWICLVKGSVPGCVSFWTRVRLTTSSCEHSTLALVWTLNCDFWFQIQFQVLFHDCFYIWFMFVHSITYSLLTFPVLIFS